MTFRVISARPARRALLACLVAGACLSSSLVKAVPVTFALNSSQSSINLGIKNAQLFGTDLTLGEQATGSLNSKYTGNIVTDITGSSINFPGGSSADASVLTKTVIFVQVPVDLSPGVGGVGAPAAADYGVQLSAPIGFDIPPIDLSALGVTIPGLPSGTVSLDLGSFQSIVVNMALRDVMLDVTSSGPIIRSGVPNNTTFDSTALDFALSGNADTAVGAVLRADNYAAYTLNNLALQGLASLINAQVPNLLTVSGYNFLNFGGPYDLTLSLGTRLPFSGINVPNDDASLGKLTTISGNRYQLSVPVSFNPINDLSSLGALSGLFSSLFNVNLAMSGQLVGTVSRTGIVIPEPGSVVTLGIGVVALAGFCWRRRRA